MRQREKILEALLFLLPIIVYMHNLITGVFYWEDVSFLHIPLRWFVHNALKNHTSPYFIWNFGFGLPLVAEGQVGFFYPLKYVFIWLNNIHQGYTLEMFATYFLAYWGMVSLSREMGLKKGSYIAGIMYAFTGPLAGRHPFMNMVEVFSLMPWVFLTARRFLHTKKLKYALITSILISFQIFAYHPQALFMSSTTLLLYLLFEKDSTISIKDKIVFVIGIHLIGILLSLPQLLPSINLLMEKGTISLPKFRGGYLWMQKGGLNFLIHFPYFFFPRYQGFHLIIRRFLSIESITITLSGILLARIALLSREKTLKVWKIIAIISFILMFVKFNPIYLVLSKLPIIKNFRYHVRWIIPFVFSLSVLAGHGFESLITKPDIVKHTRRMFYFIIGLLATHYTLAIITLGEKVKEANILTFSEWSNLILLFIYILLFILFITNKYRIIGLILPGVFLFEIYIVTTRLFVTKKSDEVQKIMYSYKPIKNTRFFREGISFPVSIYDSIRKTYYLSGTDTIKLTNIYYRYYTGNLFIEDNDETNSPFTAPQLISNFLLSACYITKDTIPEIAKSQFFKIFGINAIVTTTPLNINNFSEKTYIFPFHIYRTEIPYPRYRFYSLSETISNFTLRDFLKNPVKWDTVLPIFENKRSIVPCREHAKVLSMEFSGDTLVINTETTCSKYLFIPYRYHHGMRALINGKEAEILKSFGGFITLMVPANKSCIKLYYTFPYRWTIVTSAIMYTILLTILTLCKNCTFKEN